MKIKSYLLLTFMFGLSLLSIAKSESALFDSETASAYFAAAECFGDCGEVTAEENLNPELLFYANDAENAVGFVANNVSEYDSLDYEIAYTHSTELGEVNELVAGSIDNSAHYGTILEQWVVLGTCSSGGVCTYFEGVTQVDLTVDLIKGSSVEQTLTDSLSL